MEVLQKWLSGRRECDDMVEFSDLGENSMMRLGGFASSCPDSCHFHDRGEVSWLHRKKRDGGATIGGNRSFIDHVDFDEKMTLIEETDQLGHVLLQSFGCCLWSGGLLFLGFPLRFEGWQLKELGTGWMRDRSVRS